MLLLLHPEPSQSSGVARLTAQRGRGGGHHAAGHQGSHQRVDIKMRQQEAIRVLESLELQIEQYRLHIKELSAHPSERTRAEVELKKLLGACAVQRTYCDLLAQEQQAVSRKNDLNAA